MAAMDDTSADEAFVETVDDGFEEPSFPEDVGSSQASEHAGILWTLVLNPWVWVATGVVLWLLTHKLRPRLREELSEWSRRRQEAAELAHVKKNPDAYRERMEAMELARRRLQDQYDAAAQQAAEQQRQKDEERRKQKLEELENLAQGKGYRNKVHVERVEMSDGVNGSNSSGGSKAKKASFRPDYNPLMGSGGGGSGGSCGFRPGRRGPSAGGG